MVFSGKRAERWSGAILQNINEFEHVIYNNNYNENKRKLAYLKPIYFVYNYYNQVDKLRPRLCLLHERGR
jgi:hypothetical protein